MLRTIGLMSGTSLDGVDAAYLETDGERIGAFGPTLTLPYDDTLRTDLRRLLTRAPGLDADDPDLASAVTRLTEAHVAAVRALGREADVIGFHGQTILHQPQHRRTWQIGDAEMLAARTGMRVAFDFRSADVAVLNIGGVANVTFIGRDGTLLAFDTGPGNGPLDDWTSRHTGAAFDRDGALTRAGQVDRAVLGRLLADPYFARPAPKSLDRLDFAARLEASGVDQLSPADGAATLVAFTAGAVAGAALPERPVRWLVTGGGRRNPAIMGGLAAALGVPVAPVETVGWDGDALEAQCFGFLAARTLAGLPVSFPGTTGVAVPMTGGQVVG